MAKGLIGSWGTVVFEVSGFGAFTFSEITQDASGRWAVHEPVNTAPISEYLGPGQDKVEIKILLSKQLGADPKEKYEMLRKLVRRGKHFPFIYNGTPLSGNMWYIETINGSSSVFEAGTGEILWMEVSCQFKEYL